MQERVTHKKRCMRIALMNACRAADPRPTRVRRPSRKPRATPHTPQPLPLQDVADSTIIFNHRALFTLPKNALASTYITALILHDVFYWSRCILFLFLSLNRYAHYLPSDHSVAHHRRFHNNKSLHYNCALKI